MSKKNSATIKINADTKNAESGLNKVTAQLNKLGKNKSVTSIKNLGGAIAGIGIAFSTITKTLSAVKETITQTTEAYKQQIKAEKLLETAAQNNPYLNRDSVKNLIDDPPKFDGRYTKDYY